MEIINNPDRQSYNVEINGRCMPACPSFKVREAIKNHDKVIIFHINKPIERFNKGKRI